MEYKITTTVNQKNESITQEVNNSLGNYIVQSIINLQEKGIEEALHSLGWTKKSISVKEAIDRLITELNTDYGYFISWLANIKMAFIDASKDRLKGSKNFITEQEICEVAEKAAERFLSNLTYKPEVEFEYWSVGYKTEPAENVYFSKKCCVFVGNLDDLVKTLQNKLNISELWFNAIKITKEKFDEYCELGHFSNANDPDWKP